MLSSFLNINKVIGRPGAFNTERIQGGVFIVKSILVFLADQNIMLLYGGYRGDKTGKCF